LTFATTNRITITGGNFTQTNNCGTTLAINASCTITVTFVPGAAGPLNAQVNINDNAANTPQTVPLSGTGVTPSATLSPTSLTFGPRTSGTTSAVQSASLSNTSGVTISLTYGTSGPDPGSFTRGGTCGATIGAGGSCTITYTFTPSGTVTAPTNRAAMLTVSSAGTGLGTISLSGTQVTTSPFLSPSPLAFGAVTGPTALPLTITNSGNNAIQLSAPSISGASAARYQITGNTCPTGNTSLAKDATCTITVTFTPSGTASQPATLSLPNDANDQTVSLTGS
jgi:hypothetical protein